MQNAIEGKSDCEDHIRVMVRVRPLNSKELDQNDARIVQFGQDNQTLRVDLAATEAGASRSAKNYKFDRVFDEESTQPMIFSEFTQLLERALEGFNCTIFTYGQTGSGKTHTMLGHDIWSLAMETQQTSMKNDSRQSRGSDSLFSHAGMSGDLRGILPRTLQWLFDRKQSDEASEVCTTTRIIISYLEIYNEKLFDLLETPADDDKRGRLRAGSGLDIRLDSASKRGVSSVHVPGLTEIEVHNEREVFEVLWKGAVNRSMAATDMNEHSSRSHTVFTVKLDRKSDFGARTSKICLVDLAGSEKWRAHQKHTEARIKELVSINQSLSNLGNCIVALTTPGRTHIPYRNSRLTRLLQDSLGGNTKTIFIVTLSPAVANADVSASTLQFADRAMRVQVYAGVNESLFVDPNGLTGESIATIQKQKEIIGKYEREVARLKELLRIALKNDGKESMEVISDKLDEGLAKEVQELRAENVRLMEDLSELKDKYEELRQEKQMIVDVVMRSTGEDDDDSVKLDDGDSTGDSVASESGDVSKTSTRVRVNLLKLQESLLERRKEELEIEEQAQEARMKWLDTYRDWLRTLPVVPQDGEESLEVSDRLNLMETSLVVQSEELMKAKRAFLKSRHKDQDRLQNVNVELQETQGASHHQVDVIESQQSQIDSLKDMIRNQSLEIRKIAQLAETSTASAVAAANSALMKQSLLEEEVRRQSMGRTALPLDPQRPVPLSRIPKLPLAAKAVEGSFGDQTELLDLSLDSILGKSKKPMATTKPPEPTNAPPAIAKQTSQPSVSSVVVKKPPEPKLPPPGVVMSAKTVGTAVSVVVKPTEPSQPPKKYRDPLPKEGPAAASDDSDASGLPRQAVLDQVSRMLDFAASVSDKSAVGTPLIARSVPVISQPPLAELPPEPSPKLNISVGARKMSPSYILSPSEAYMNQHKIEPAVVPDKEAVAAYENPTGMEAEASSRQADIDRLRAKIRKSTGEVASTLPKLPSPSSDLPSLPADMSRVSQTSSDVGNKAKQETGTIPKTATITKKKKAKKLWAEYMDVSTQNMYYHNRVTGKTQWDRPCDEEMSQMVPPSDD